MERLDAAQPISITLDGANYVLWAQAMSSFIKGRKLWRIITGEIVKPTKEDTETQPKFAERLEDWDSKNHMMITWFRNTSVTSLSLQFGRFQNHDGPAKAIWDFLKERYNTTGLAHQYQLLSNLHRLRQEPGQSINDFLSQVYCVWDQLALSEPTWSCTIDAQRFTNHKDQQRLILFLMALTPDFEPVRASLLHRSPLPTLEQAISELLSEETRLAVAADATSSSTLDTSVSPISISDIEAIVKQVISSSGTPPPTALSTTSDEFDAGPISENSLTASPEEDVPSADLAPASPQLEHIDSSPSSPAPDVTPPPRRSERRIGVEPMSCSIEEGITQVQPVNEWNGGLEFSLFQVWKNRTSKKGLGLKSTKKSDSHDILLRRKKES
ncbi:hypothetical protein Vadar_032587 [Vaccinium darrowii]|uniref:Uncharacterized protein n=1 Tax=Vaccinium darrowii TaxID=229202 RepID=A0ACB7YIN6_9ERIC|nr:hypothetical protein Vadar_032587 [Vaccinium darrowii]